MILWRSMRCASEKRRDPQAITKNVPSRITSNTVQLDMRIRLSHCTNAQRGRGGACFLSLGIFWFKNVPMRTECTTCKQPTSADLTSHLRALMTELQELLPWEVDRDRDIVIKMSATWISVIDAKSTCNAVQVLKKDVQLEIYFIAVPGATLSKILFRCILWCCDIHVSCQILDNGPSLDNKSNHIWQSKSDALETRNLLVSPCWRSGGCKTVERGLLCAKSTDT